MIVDAHVHLGPDKVFGRDCNEDDLIRAMKKNGIDCVIVQPGHDNTGLKATKKSHDRVAKFCLKYKGRAYGMCSINPHFGSKNYKEEANRCVLELGFVGIKVHPIVHAWHPLLVDGRLPFETAAELKVPLMVHVGTGFPLSDPMNLLPLCEEFPEVDVILAHAGVGNGFRVLAREYPNTYLETSFGGSRRFIQGFVKEFGAHRVIFGSNGPDEMEHALWRYHLMREDELHYPGLSEEQLEWCLGKSALTVFQLPHVAISASSIAEGGKAS